MGQNPFKENPGSTDNFNLTRVLKITAQSSLTLLDVSHCKRPQSDSFNVSGGCHQYCSKSSHSYSWEHTGNPSYDADLEASPGQLMSIQHQPIDVAFLYSMSMVLSQFVAPTSGAVRQYSEAGKLAQNNMCKSE